MNPVSPTFRKDLQLKRTLLLLASVSAVLSLPATASAFRGVAVAKDAVDGKLTLTRLKSEDNEDDDDDDDGEHEGDE